MTAAGEGPLGKGYRARLGDPKGSTGYICSIKSTEALHEEFEAHHRAVRIEVEGREGSKASYRFGGAVRQQLQSSFEGHWHAQVTGCTAPHSLSHTLVIRRARCSVEGPAIQACCFSAALNWL